MQPYQKAAENIRRSGEKPIELAKNLGIAAVSGGAAKIGSSIAGSIAPKIGALISPYVPEDLSIKGLTKLDPRLGKFIQGVMNEGADYDEIRSYLGDKIKKTENNKIEKKKTNIIQKYSPELHQFLEQEIRSGRKPIEAAAIAQNDKRFSSIISKITKENNTPWSSIIDSVFGQSIPESTPSQTPPNNQPIRQQTSPNMVRLANVLKQPQQKQGQGQQEFINIMQKINQRLGK